MGDYHGLSRWVQCNHKGPHVRRMLKVRVRERDRTVEAEVKGM